MGLLLFPRLCQVLIIAAFSNLLIQALCLVATQAALKGVTQQQTEALGVSLILYVLFLFTHRKYLI